MFFLYDMFLNQNAILPTANKNIVDTVKISNGIFNHLNLLSKIDVTINNFNTTIPTQWTDNTLLDATFNNSIDGGSINNFIGEVDHLDIQRKAQDSSEWITLQQIFKNQVTENIALAFSMDDATAKNGELYTYQIVPVDSNGNQGMALQQDVWSLFNDAYIADGKHIYKITYDYSLSKGRQQVSAVYTPYGSKVPYVAYNAETNYDSGSVTAVLLAPTSMSMTKSYLDRQAQLRLIEEFNTWLTNGRAKILKDFNGQLKIITIIDSVSNDYYKELGNGLASVSFSFVEIGFETQYDFNRLGLCGSFDLKVKNNN